MNKVLAVLTYAPAGLGHIRVADALISGIPAGMPYVEFSPSDKTTESMHRFTSLNVPARHVMEYFQRGAPETLFTKVYTDHLKRNTASISYQFLKLINSREDEPENIIVIATHFGLAYQLGAAKKRLEEELGVSIKLVVQVTDDSPQIIWYVDSADLIICPSTKTKETLLKFAHRYHLRDVPLEVAPYPVDLEFAKVLPADKVLERKNQYDPSHGSPINIIIPVSGAAVGMEFFMHLISELHRRSPRFFFHVVCRKAPFTANFLSWIGQRNYIKLHVSSDYKNVVEMYQRVYMENTISGEVTKPSEQCFKALLRPDSVGGSSLFLAEPVGRQEYDNINFLKRHGYLSDESNKRRGYVLPHGSKASADLIWDLYYNKKALNAFNVFSYEGSDDETGDDGVTRFWDIVSRL